MGTSAAALLVVVVGSLFVSAGAVVAAPVASNNSPPIRVVSQTVGSDELLLALADPGQVAALSELAVNPDYSAVAAQAHAYPHLVPGDAETVLKFAPTLVLFADYSRAELVAHVRAAGVRVIRFDRYRTLEDSFANLRLLARELGPKAQERAERIIADCENRVHALAAKLHGVQPVRVIAPSVYGVIAGTDTTFQDLCDHAGANNLATTLGHLHGHQPPPSEQMLGWPIDKVVLTGASVASALVPYRNLPPYALLPAVRSERVALLQPYMISCVTYHRVEAYELLARQLHPEAFK